jgi:hypothetical protein
MNPIELADGPCYSAPTCREVYAAGYRAGIERAAKVCADTGLMPGAVLADRIRSLLDEPQEPPK